MLSSYEYQMCCQYLWLCGDLMHTRLSRSSRKPRSPMSTLLSGISLSTEAWQTRWAPPSRRPVETRVPTWSTLTLDALFSLRARQEKGDVQLTLFLRLIIHLRV